MKRTIGVLMTAGNNAAAAGSNGFYRTLTLDQPASDLTDFPVLFSGTFTYLKTIANSGKVNNANGYDIVFYSDVTLTTKLKFERTFWDATTGVVEFWVKVPTLTSASALVIYLAYGNTSISTDQQDVDNTWNTNYQLVYHLPNGTSLTANDSSGNSNNGTITGAVAIAGKIDGGASFDGIDDLITSATLPTNATTNIALSCWVYPTDISSDFIIIYNGDSGANGYGIYINGGIISLLLGAVILYNFNSAIVQNAWNHIVITRDATTWRLYLNSSLDVNTITTNPNAPATATFQIADLLQRPTVNQPMIVDEVRVLTTPLTANWIAAEYSNQNDPANFYIIGTETAA